MAANLRIRLGFTVAVGPFHPTGKADVSISVRPEPDGTARVAITRMAFIKNPLFTAAAGVMKERLTDQINGLVRDFIRDLPKSIPYVEEVSILEIEDE